MALTDGQNGNGLIMPVSPMYGGGGGFGGNGNGDWGWIILLLLLGWGNNRGFGGNGGGNGSDLYPWMNQSNQFNDGFQNLQLSNQIGNVQDGVNGLSNQICNSFAAVEANANNRQMGMIQQMFDLNSQFQQCCCENRLASANLQTTIANSANSIIQANNANTQSIKDQMYQDKMDAKNDEIAQLRQEILYARGQASQIAQNQQIVDSIYNRLDTCPVGTTPVYGRTPIFTCNNGMNGCGCGCNGSLVA